MTAALKARWMLLALGAVLASGAQAQGVYRCPGPPVLYTDQITPAQAKEKNCHSIDGTPISVVSPPKPRPQTSSSSSGSSGGASSADNRIDRNDQRARDSDARRILESELRQEEDRLKDMEREYNSGQPERRAGDERNFEKYQERVSQLKAALDRKQSDIAAIRRELSKFSGSITSSGPTASGSKN